MLREDSRIPGHKFSSGASASAKGDKRAIAEGGLRFPKARTYHPGLQPRKRLFRPPKGPFLNLSKTKINALLALALFTFAFLAAEFRFDINIGLLAGAERVVLAQGFILGASVLGFIGYAPLLGLAQRKGHSLAAVNAAAVPIVIPGLAQIQFPTGPLTLEILGRIAFFGLGLLGAATHHAFSLAFQDGPKLATGAGATYAAGVVFDLAERRYMGLVMLGIAVLSTISILAVEAGADPNLGLVVFYLSSGFFVTFFTATFTQLAPRMHAPALWAGMGRAANNACAFTTSGISLALVTSGNVALIMIGALVLLVAACAAFVAAGLFRLPQTEQERKHQQLAEEALAAPTIEEQRQAFITDHALTPREVDVLVAVTQDERPLKQIAEELGISMRMVQRHLSSIYQKTDTQTRAGLTKAFPSA